MQLTLFCISLTWIESNFVFWLVVSFAIHVATLGWIGPMIDVRIGVGRRIYQIHPKDVLWGSNPATLTAMAIHQCCSEWRNSRLPLLYGAEHCSAEAYVTAKYRLYNVEPLNFIGHTQGLFWSCNILLPIYTTYADYSGMLFYVNGKLTMGKLISFIFSSVVSFILNLKFSRIYIWST